MDTFADVFTHDDKQYDLTKVRILTRTQPTFILPIRDLLWVLKFDKPSEDRIAKAKIRYPLLVSKWRGKWTVVDGLHRLEMYRRRGIVLIPVKEVDKSMLEKCRVNES